MQSHLPPRLVALCVCFSLLLAVPGAAGQGSAADYARSADLAGELRGKVLNERLDAVWLDARTLLCKIETETGNRFERVDAETGERGPAFDHAALAESLGVLLARRVSPADLPLERIALDGDRLLALVAGETRVVEIDPETSEARTARDDMASVFTLAPTRARASVGGDGDTAILFRNTSDAPVDILWVDHAGGERRYATIGPGKSHRQHTYVGHLWLVRGADGAELGRYMGAEQPGLVILTGRPAELPEAEPRRWSPRLASPDGRYDVRLEESNAVVVRRGGGGEVFRTTDGSPQDRYIGRVYWSPDSTRLVIIREEPEQQHTVTMVDSSPDDQLQPRLLQQQYLKPGDRIAHPRPVLIDLEKNTSRAVAEKLIPNPWSLGEFTWDLEGDAFWFLYNQRGHQVLRVVRVDADSGEARAVVNETSSTFVDYAGKLYMKPLLSRRELVWMSERSGYNHLYLIDMDSGHVIRPLTSGNWLVRSVEGIDEDARTVSIETMGMDRDQDPYHVHHARVDLDTGTLTRLTTGDGMHDLSPSPDGAYYVDTYSRVDLAPVHELRRSSDGSLVTELIRADASALASMHWQTPERFVAKGRDGKTDIWGVIFRPSGFDPARSYPVLENIYAGPHGHFVPKKFDVWHGSRTFAELGFVVVQIDGMGTNWRSRAFHDVAWKNLADSGFPDRTKWIRAAASDRPWMDVSRVGIYGGSAGGQSALRAVLGWPDFYRAAVADCGCHDNRMDKIWWNELWMGWPVGPHYAEQSNVMQAHRLEGDLLLIVGELDTNVDPASTMQVADALIKADKDFDLLVMPGVGHGAMGTPYGRRRAQDFFVRKLLHREPRWTE